MRFTTKWAAGALSQPEGSADNPGRTVSRPLSACILGLGLLLAVSVAGAITPMTTDELVAHCSNYAEAPDSADTLICSYYVQGFVAGAIATDERVSRNVVKELAESKGYAESYYDIRFGRPVQQYGPTYFAEFCVPDDVPLLQVVEKIVYDLAEPGFLDDTPLARDAVYKALRKDYACE